MPIVAMPDGTRVSFPDDMPSDQIRSMIVSKFPDAAKQAAAGQQPVDNSLSGTAMDALKGIPSAIMGRLSGLASAGGQAAATEMSDPELASQIPNAAQSQDILEKNVTGPLYKSQTPAGRVLSDTAASAFDPTSYIGPGGPLRALLSSLTANAMSGAGGEVASAMGATPQQEMAARLILAGASPTFAGKSFAGSPSVAALKDTAGAGYDELRNSTQLATAPSAGFANGKFVTTPAPHADWAQNELNDLAQANKGSNAFDNPAARTETILNKVVNKTTMNASDYDALKGALRRVTQDGGSDADAARSVLGGLNDHIAGLDQNTPGVYGDVDKFKQLWSENNANYAAGSRRETVENTLGNALEAARDDASGLNVGNKIRQAFKPLLKDDAEKLRFSGFSDPEIAATRGIGRGVGPFMLRMGSNMLGGGGGIGSLIAGGIAASGGAAAEGPMGGFAGPAAILAGLSLRHGYNTITRSRAEALARMVGARSPLGGNVLPSSSQAILLKRLLNAGQAVQ